MAGIESGMVDIMKKTEIVEPNINEKNDLKTLDNLNSIYDKLIEHLHSNFNELFFIASIKKSLNACVHCETKPPDAQYNCCNSLTIIDILKAIGAIFLSLSESDMQIEPRLVSFLEELQDRTDDLIDNVKKQSLVLSAQNMPLEKLEAKVNRFPESFFLSFIGVLMSAQVHHRRTVCFNCNKYSNIEDVVDCSHSITSLNLLGRIISRIKFINNQFMSLNSDPNVNGYFPMLDPKVMILLNNIETQIDELFSELEPNLKRIKKDEEDV